MSPSILQVESLYEIEFPQWIFCLRQCKQGGAIWSDGVRKLELKKLDIIHCVNGKLEADGEQGGLYLTLS